MENDQHSVVLENKNELKITGVVDIENFNEEVVVIITNMGTLTVNGIELKISELTEGNVHIRGSVEGINYNPERKKKEKLFNKIFK